MSAQAKTYNMVTTRVFDAPVEQVWQAWSESHAVMRWWGPTGFTAPVAKIDFREGGTSLVCMRSPDGHDMYNTWTYTKIVLMQQIEFINRFADQDGKQIAPSAIGLPPEIPQEVPHVITFNTVGKNQTELTVTEFGYLSEQVAAFSKAGMDECLDKMQARLK